MNNAKYMDKKDKVIKRLLLAVAALLIYTALTSSIISLRSESRVSEALMDSVLTWSDKFHDDRAEVIAREKTQSLAPDPVLAQRLRGRLLLQAESRGEAWYVHPDSIQRHYLGRSDHAFALLEIFKQELAAEELMEYLYNNDAFPQQYLGRILYSRTSSERYYIDPVTRHALKYAKPGELMQLLSSAMLGIADADLRKIPVADDIL